MSADILSERGKQLLSLNGFIYRKHKTLETGITKWRCIHRCGGWVSEFEGTKVITKSHLAVCEPSSIRIQTKEAKTAIKQQAKDRLELPPSKIKDGVLATLPASVRPHLPKDKSILSVIAKSRQQKRLREPETRNVIVLPLEMTLTSRGKPFLIFDSGDSNRLLVFATERNLVELFRCKIWFIDGTFKSAPDLYDQVVTIHGATSDGFNLPLVFALTANRRKSTYQAIFQALVNASPEIAMTTTPEILISDFECAIISAAKCVFPTVSIQLCLFHLSQSIKRNLPPMLSKKVQNGDCELELLLKHFSALAFIPPAEVSVTFSELKTKISVDDDWKQYYEDLLPFFDYFSKYYINGSDLNGPRYKPELWNVHYRVLENVPRTNNIVEGWNHGFNAKLERDHPQVLSVLKLFQEEQCKVEDKLELRLSGSDPKMKLWKYEDLDQRLLKLVTNYLSNDKFDYLRGVAHCMLRIKKQIKKSNRIF